MSLSLVRSVAGPFTTLPSMPSFNSIRPHHDRKEKTILGHTLPAGRGEQDGLDVIDILAHHPSTAKFISRKLAQRFVADDPPQALVDRMAATFTKTDGDLRAVLQTMFSFGGVHVGRRMAGKNEIASGNGGQLGARG